MDVEPVGQETFQTISDMDLIDILWRQDMDMGVSKETFNIHLRKELEKDEQELKVKVEEKTNEAVPATELPADDTQEENVTFIVDDETGELVAAPPGTVLPQRDSQPMDTSTQLGEEQGQLLEEAISILQAEANGGHGQLPQSSNIVDMPTTSSHPQSVVDMVNANVTHNEIDALVQNMSQLTGLTFSRQASLEARWNDVQGLITEVEAAATLPTEADFSVDRMSTNAALIQDASLALGQQANNLTETMPSPGEDILSLNLNESQMLINLTTDMPTLFPNNSMVISVPSHSNTSRDLLSDILGEVNELNNMSFPTQIDNNTGFQPIKYEDSDSAVGGSLGSPGSSLMEYGDSRSEITSPFDGLEGATGGSEDSEKSVIKYDPIDNDYNSYSTLDWDTQIQASNSSGESNDTDLGFTMANPHHVSHNHTYPLRPGQEARESKSYPTSSRRSASAAAEREKKVQGHNRDQRKAKAMKIPFSISEIINSPVDTFNDMITKYKFNDAQLQLIKDIRRRGKNKVAAQNCRKRKMEVIETLDQSVQRMRNEKETFLRQKVNMERERDKLRNKYNTLYRDVFQSLRDENGLPYDPSEYTLQHTADGNVFLMPRTNRTAQHTAGSAAAAAEDPELKRGRKRKGSKK